MERNQILSWLLEEDEGRLNELWQWSDQVRRKNVGTEVHLRGLIEISNHCIRQCGYCGLRSDHKGLERYRMGEEEILASVSLAQNLGYGTVVLQAGEDYGIKRGWLSHVIGRIKTETPLAVTLSMGERRDKDLEAWRKAGADRYLLRFETSDPSLYRLIHPTLYPGRLNRLALLRRLKGLGYEVGSGVMIGIPGQTYESLAHDIDLFRRFDLDMIGVGPYLLHPSTPLGKGEWRRAIALKDQVPNTEEMTYKVIALTRIVCPDANIPSTTALATVNRDRGRLLGLMRGANVVMPNVTPLKYRVLYEIYPSKACIKETPPDCSLCLHRQIESIGRVVGGGPGSRPRRRPLSSSRYPISDGRLKIRNSQYTIHN